MGEIVNLRRARKDRARQTAESEAAANRAQHGRTRAERETEDARRALEARKLDAHRLRDQDHDG